MSRSLPRGIRNNNPGNIEVTRPRTPWQGRVLPDSALSDGRFEQFVHARGGIRALARTLITYQDKHGCDTVRKIIARWAPPVENDTGAYVRMVAQHLGVDPGETIDVQQYAVMRPLVEAIIRHENGDPTRFGRRAWYERDVIDAGLRLAGIEPPPFKVAVAQDPEAVSSGTAAGGIAGVALVEAGQQIQSVSAAAGNTLETLRWVFVALIVAGVCINLWHRLRRAKREGQ